MTDEEEVLLLEDTKNFTQNFLGIPKKHLPYTYLGHYPNSFTMTIWIFEDHLIWIIVQRFT